MINIELEIRKSLYSKLSDIFSSSNYVVGDTVDYDSIDDTKIYIWTTTFNNNIDYFDREFGNYYIDIHILAENTLKLSLVEEELYGELDKESIGNYNYSVEILNSIEFTDTFNKVVHPVLVLSTIISGGIKTYFEYTNLTSGYTLF